VKAAKTRDVVPNVLPIPITVAKQKTISSVEKPITSNGKVVRAIVILLAIALVAVALAQNGLYSLSRGANEDDKYLFLAIGLCLEGLHQALPVLQGYLW